MLQNRYSRGGYGNGTDNQDSKNLNYYLYITNWYFTNSPNNLWSDGCASINHLRGNGSLDGNGVPNIGGVQF